MEVRYRVRSADWVGKPAPRAAESIHFPSHFRSFGWDHKCAYFPLTVLGPYYMYRNGEVIIFLPGKKCYHFFSFSDRLHLYIPSDFSPVHHFIFIYHEFRMTFYHLSLSLLQSFLTELGRIRPCVSHLAFDEQTAKRSKQLHCSSMNQPWYRLTQGLQPVPSSSRGIRQKGCRCYQDYHPHQPPLALGFSNQVQDFGKCSCCTSRQEKEAQLAACWPDTDPISLHPHREEDRGNQSSSRSAWLFFESYTFLLLSPENHW